MAVAIIIDFKGATLDHYDQVVEKMDLGGQMAPGGLFHWACATDDGFRVVDVWEDRASFDKFAQEKIDPVSREVSLPNPPEIKEVPIHSYMPQ